MLLGLCLAMTSVRSVAEHGGHSKTVPINPCRWYFHQAQHLDIFLATLLAHPGFQQTPQLLELLRKIPVL